MEDRRRPPPPLQRRSPRVRGRNSAASRRPSHAVGPVWGTPLRLRPRPHRAAHPTFRKTAAAALCRRAIRAEPGGRCRKKAYGPCHDRHVRPHGYARGRPSRELWFATNQRAFGVVEASENSLRVSLVGKDDD